MSVCSGRTGKFQITDDGVKGEGTYTLGNQTADINLHLLIGNILKGPTIQAMNVPILKPHLKDTSNNQTKQDNMEQQRKQPAETVKQENADQQGKKNAGETVKQENAGQQRGETASKTNKQDNMEPQGKEPVKTVKQENTEQQGKEAAVSTSKQEEEGKLSDKGKI